MYEKRIFRTGKSADYPVSRVDNRLLNDNSLSYAARGLMCYLLSKPNSWILIKENLINNSPAGSTAVNGFLNELEKAGYIESKPERTSTGRFANKVFLIYEHKSLKKSEEVEVKRDLSRCDTHSGKSTMGKPSEENLRLVTNDFNNEKITTTTPTKDLIWPAKIKISNMQQQSIIKMAGGVDSKITQDFLDEMQNTTRVIRNPVAYFNDLLHKHMNGNYIPSGALAESQRRESKQKAEESYEAMKQESIRQGEEFLAKYLKGLA